MINRLESGWQNSTNINQSTFESQPDSTQKRMYKNFNERSMGKLKSLRNIETFKKYGKSVAPIKLSFKQRESPEMRRSQEMLKMNRIKLDPI